MNTMYNLSINFISGVMFGIELVSPEEEDDFDWGAILDLGIFRFMLFKGPM